MNPKVAERLEKTLVLALVASLTLPMVLAGLLLVTGTNGRATAWLRNATLGGVLAGEEPVSLSPANVSSGRYQRAVAKHYDTHFTGREILIRLIDEIYLRIFHTTSADVLEGPHGSLIKKEFAEDYCLRRGNNETLVPLVQDLRRMQDFCDARGIAFALVITPSKASIYPENLPASWLSRYQPGPRYYDLFVPLLREYGIRYVDGHRQAAEMKPFAKVPLFALGGIHWNEPTALATANATLELLASKGLDVQPIHHYRTEYSNHPNVADYDMFNLINVTFPRRYPVASLDIPPTPSRNTYKPNIVFIGGSFVWNMLKALDASRQFSELEFYFYYSVSQHCRADGELYKIGAPTPPVNFSTDIFAADALVLEANEEFLDTGAHHLREFLGDALAVLPDPHGAKAPFRFETRMNYRWGDTLSLVASQQPINTVAMTGFLPPAPQGTYTVGPEAIMRLHIPPTSENMLLAVDASAFLVDKRLPEQRVRVSANGHPVGEWIWRADTPPHHELLIPKEDFSGSELRLEFHIARPGSPAEFGLSSDTAAYGIILANMKISAEPQIAYRWGETLSLVAGAPPFDTAALSGFTGLQPKGIYTLGKESVMRLHVPPTEGDMTLGVNARAFVVDTRLPEQRVSVLANGHPIAEWVWKTDALDYREAVIPREFLGGSELRLEFRVARPGSPAEFGLSRDTNAYGIIIDNLKIGVGPRIAYRWGETLSFVAGEQSFDPHALLGFSALTPHGAYTLGKKSVMRLHVPPTEGDMTLGVNARAFVVDTRLPEQRVSVLANGHPIAEWVWKTDALDYREAIIPREFLGGSELRLEFRVARPGSPAEFGLGSDTNAYGIIIDNLRLQANESWIRYRWGDKLSLGGASQTIPAAALSGFTPPTPAGAYTDGPVSVIQLEVPPTDEDMVLAVNASAFVVDKRLPEQRVSVWVNGRSVGEWVWKNRNLSYRELTIPKGTLREGKMKLEFRIARPGSPAEFGLSADTHKYGILISSVRMHELGK